MNISIVENNKTAKTNIKSAMQRAENLFILGSKNVLELCVGPSLKDLEECYSKFNIKVTGNDIEKRWKEYYPKGSWIIGDCFNIDYSKFDTIVFAPPLSKGCTGRREDSLSIDQVFPTYNDFLLQSHTNKLKVLVLPGRSFATKEDRKQFYKLTSKVRKYDLVPLTDGKIVKYWDLYV